VPRRAHKTGFDGVDIHAANVYLLYQFLRDKTNRRADRYGGSIENRARLLLEVADAVIAVWGGERAGVRLSPMNPFNDIADSDPAATFGHTIRALDRLGLAYLHLVEPEPGAVAPGGARLDARYYRPMWRGPLIANRGYDRQRATDLIAEGAADLVAFGVLFLANPDLPERFRREAAQFA
jgi:N-ethylmaleimide reductase